MRRRGSVVLAIACALVGCGRIGFEGAEAADGRDSGARADAGGVSRDDGGEADGGSDGAADAGGEIPDLVARCAMDDPAVPGTIQCEPSIVGNCETDRCPTPAAGRIATALAFDGDDYVELPGTLLDADAPYTVAAWVLPSASSTNGTVVGKPIAAASNDAFGLVVGSASGELIHETTTPAMPMDYLVSSGIDLRVGGFRHVAASWDGATKRIYIDGALAGMQDASVSDTDGPVFLGTDVDDSVPVWGYAGAIDDVRFYDRALDDTEIAALASP